MGTRPNPFRDPKSPGRPWPGVGDGVDPCPCHMLPLQSLGPNKRGQRKGRLGSFWSLQTWGATAPSMGSPPWGGDSHGVRGQQGWS